MIKDDMHQISQKQQQKHNAHNKIDNHVRVTYETVSDI